MSSQWERCWGSSKIRRRTKNTDLLLVLSSISPCLPGTIYSFTEIHRFIVRIVHSRLFSTLTRKNWVVKKERGTCQTSLDHFLAAINCWNSSLLNFPSPFPSNLANTAAICSLLSFFDTWAHNALVCHTILRSVLCNDEEKLEKAVKPFKNIWKRTVPWQFMNALIRGERKPNKQHNTTINHPHP